ncbi:MAG TPA: PAS domain-containing protein [Xanthobacteraceae bacterium]|nr:PAS domain-containing protein [Xanthobacteraceae bacterium]
MSNASSAALDTTTFALAAFLEVEQSVLDAVPAGLCVCDAEGLLRRYNTRAQALWGRAPQCDDPAEIDTGMFRRFASDGSPLPFAATPVGVALRTGATLLDAELAIERPDGSRIPVLMSVAPLKDAAGRVEGAVCSFAEFTERKRAEDELRASEAELQTVINRTPFMLVRCSRDLRYRFISQAYAEWVGRPREEVLGKTIAETIGEICFATLLPHIQKVLAGTPVDFECEMEFRVVGRRFLHIAYRPETDAAGNVNGWIASLLDITQRKRTEAELRLLSEALGAEVERRTLERDRIWNVSEDLLGVRNFEGYFISLNPAWTRLLGWSEAEIKAMHVNELRHPDDASAGFAAVQQLAQGASSVRTENRVRHKDGSYRWLQWTMTENNGLIYVAGRHVTAEKEAAAALEQAQLRAAHLQKMEAIGQLTGGIAHDFNNLLMIVSGHAQRLKGRLGETRDVRAVQAIEKAASRGENLTRQLLGFARTLPLDPSVLSLRDTINGLRDVLAGSLHVNVALAVDIPDTVWAVCVDKPELELALVNLAVNARDAMPDGGTLSITAANVQLREGDTPGEAVALTVADTGCGIPHEHLSRVTEPFYTTKGPDKGTGLGLSQVYGFARRSGGTMVIESDVGAGTNVTLFLPRCHAPMAPALPEDTASYRADGAYTVLVVEDNEEVRGVAVSLLDQLGYRTIAVEDSAAALETLASGHQINLVFTDVILPGTIDGAALAQVCAERYPRIPVVLTTGYSKVFDQDPPWPVLRKPYQIAALGRVIYDALHGAKERRALAG